MNDRRFLEQLESRLGGASQPPQQQHMQHHQLQANQQMHDGVQMGHAGPPSMHSFINCAADNLPSARPLPSLQSFIHVPSSKPVAKLAPSSQMFQQQPATDYGRQSARQPSEFCESSVASSVAPNAAPPQQANWRFEANPNQQVPLLELQRQHYKFNQKLAWSETRKQQYSQQQAPSSRPRARPDSTDVMITDDQGKDFENNTNLASSKPPPRQVQLPGDCSPPTATTAQSTSQLYSRAPTPQSNRRQPQLPPTQPGEMAEFSDERQTVDLCSDNEGQGGGPGPGYGRESSSVQGFDSVFNQTRADRYDNTRDDPSVAAGTQQPDFDGSAVLIPRDSGSVDQGFDCLDRSEALRKDLELAREIFGAGSLQTGRIQNLRVEEIKDQDGSVKQEAYNQRRLEALDDDDVAINDDDDIEIEIGDGVRQTASGHLLVQNQTGPVLSEQEQRAIAKRTRQEMKKRLDERNLVQYGGKCEDDKFVDFSLWPQEFVNMQSALDTYNKLGLPHRIMFRISDHIRDIGGMSTRFRLVCFHNRQITGTKKDISNSTVTSIQFKKHNKGTCPVSMTFKFKPDKPHSKRGQFVRSNHVICQHNHPLTVDERRVLTRVEIQDEIQMYLESGLTMPMIVNCVNRKFGLSLPYSAFGSVVQKVRHSIHSYIDFTQTQTMQLLQMLERMRQEDPMTRFAYLFDSHLKQRDDVDPNNPQIEALLIQTPLMARNYQAYHDVVFLDSTYNTNQLGLALAILSGISSEGKNIFLGFAFMARETTENYKWVLENFVKMNNNLSPRTILTDYDSAMATAIEMTFSTNTTHWLCQWHMMQNFKKHFVFLSKRRGAAGKLLFNHIMDCIFTESPKKFAELQDVIFSTDQLDEKKLGYLRKMFMIKEKWATSHQPPIFNAGMHTTSRVEAMNSMVKKAMQSRYTLVNLFQEILKLEQRVIRASREVLNSVDQVLVVNNPLLDSIHKTYSKWAFERMMYQHMLSHTLIVVPVTDDHVPISETIFRLKNDRTVFRVKDTETHDKTTVILIQNSIVDPQTGATFDNIRCNCRYYLSHEFFCSHIFAVLNLLQVKNAEKFHMMGRRWQKDHQETVLPGLYSMHDNTQNPEQFASQFKLYNNNGNVNQNYVFAKTGGMPNDDFGNGQDYQQINSMLANGKSSIDFVNNGQRQLEGGDQPMGRENQFDHHGMDESGFNNEQSACSEQPGHIVKNELKHEQAASHQRQLQQQQKNECPPEYLQTTGYYNQEQLQQQQQAMHQQPSIYGNGPHQLQYQQQVHQPSAPRPQPQMYVKQDPSYSDGKCSPMRGNMPHVSHPMGQHRGDQPQLYHGPASGARHHTAGHQQQATPLNLPENHTGVPQYYQQYVGGPYHYIMPTPAPTQQPAFQAQAPSIPSQTYHPSLQHHQQQLPQHNPYITSPPLSQVSHPAHPSALVKQQPYQPELRTKREQIEPRPPTKREQLDRSESASYGSSDPTQQPQQQIVYPGAASSALMQPPSHPSQQTKVEENQREDAAPQLIMDVKREYPLQQCFQDSLSN